MATWALWHIIISVIGYESEVELFFTQDLSVLAIFAAFETVGCEFYLR